MAILGPCVKMVGWMGQKIANFRSSTIITMYSCIQNISPIALAYRSTIQKLGMVSFCRA